MAKDDFKGRIHSVLKIEEHWKVLKPGDSVHADLVLRDRRDKFQCRIMGVSEDFVRVKAADNWDEDKPIPLGSRIILSMMKEGIMYGLETTVVEADKLHNIKLAVEKQSANEQRRKHIRVECYIPFRYRLLSGEKLSREKNLIMEKLDPGESTYFDFAWSREGNYNEILSDPIGRLLMEINFKLDRLLFATGRQTPDGFNEGQAEELNISGSGLAFKARDEVPLGAILEVEFALPLFPSAHIHALGEVVRMERLQTGSSALHWMIGVHFVAISEADREEIIKYTFIRQRQYLRSSS